jgi:hypothetical protein
VVKRTIGVDEDVATLAANLLKFTQEPLQIIRW